VTEAARTELPPPGKRLGVTVLLVDDRDGRILAEVETEEDARLVLEGWGRDDGSIPNYLCLVELRSHHGAILGTDSSVKIRPLRKS
jgi:hypothetical protein